MSHAQVLLALSAGEPLGLDDGVHDGLLVHGLAAEETGAQGGVLRGQAEVARQPDTRPYTRVKGGAQTSFR
jgi:hypothetical protein